MSHLREWGIEDTEMEEVDRLKDDRGLSLVPKIHNLERQRVFNLDMTFIRVLKKSVINAYVADGGEERRTV